MQKKNAKILSLIFLLFNFLSCTTIVLGTPLTELEKKEENVKTVTYKVGVFQHQLPKFLHITPEQLHTLKQNVAQKVSALPKENKNNGNNGNNGDNDSDKNKRKALKSIADLAITEYVKIAASNHICRKTNDTQAAGLLAQEISNTTLHALSQKNNLKYATEIETLEKLLKNNVTNIVWQQRKEKAWAVTAWTGNSLFSSLSFCASHAFEILKVAQFCLNFLEVSQQWQKLQLEQQQQQYQYQQELQRRELEQRQLQQELRQRHQSPTTNTKKLAPKPSAPPLPSAPARPKPSAPPLEQSSPAQQAIPKPIKKFEDSKDCPVCLEDFGTVDENGVTVVRTYFPCGHNVCVVCKSLKNQCYYFCP